MLRALASTLRAWEKTLRVVVYRKPVHHETKKNYQLDLFDPDDGYFEYSAVSTNLTLSAGALWDFMAGRGAQEKTFAELKGEWALDVGSNSSLWGQLGLAANLYLGAQSAKKLSASHPGHSKAKIT